MKSELPHMLIQMIKASAFSEGYSQAIKDMPMKKDSREFAIGEYVRKTKGSKWEGKVVGFYSTELTPEGYCVESSVHKGSVQIYPRGALERVETLR